MRGFYKQKRKHLMYVRRLRGSIICATCESAIEQNFVCLSKCVIYDSYYRKK